MLTINGTLIAVVINFVIMMWLLKRFMFGPIGAAITERQSKIRADIEHAERSLAEAKTVREDAERMLVDARAEGQAMLKRSQEQSEQLRQELQQKAKADMDALKQRAQADLVSERNALLLQMRRDAASLALAASEKMLQQIMDPSLHERLVKAAEGELAQPERVPV